MTSDPSLQPAQPSPMGTTVARPAPASTGPPVTQSTGSATVALAGWAPAASRVSLAQHPGATWPLGEGRTVAAEDPRPHLQCRAPHSWGGEHRWPGADGPRGSSGRGLHPPFNVGLWAVPRTEGGPRPSRTWRVGAAPLPALSVPSLPRGSARRELPACLPLPERRHLRPYLRPLHLPRGLGWPGLREG